MPNSNEPARRPFGDLVVALVSAYDLRYANIKPGATTQVALWHARSSQDSKMRPLGSVVAEGYRELNGTRSSLLIGQNEDAANDKPPVAAPVGYTAVWSDDRTSGARMEGSVWRPVAPPGYVALGDVAGVGLSEPSVDEVWCVRADLATAGAFTAEATLKDGGSRFTAWRAEPRDSALVAEELGAKADTFFISGNDQSRPDACLACVLSLPDGRGGVV